MCYGINNQKTPPLDRRGAETDERSEYGEVVELI